MNIEQIAALATSGESERLEFKATTGARREAARTLCAFLNQPGGGGVQVCGPVWIDRPSISRGLYGGLCTVVPRRVRLETGGSRSWGADSRKSSSSIRPALASSESWASCSMPSITGGLNGAPAGRFLDVSGWVGVLSVDSG